MKSRLKYLTVAVLLILIVSIRVLEKRFFNDGLIDFFQHDYLTRPLPDLSITQLLVIDSLRFWLNALLSIAILYLLFKQKHLLKFLFIIYGVFFVIGISAMYYLLSHYQPGEYAALFYVRRLLIQPLLLFLLLPALLYQQKNRQT